MEPEFEPVVEFDDNKRSFSPGEVVSVTIEYPSMISDVEIEGITANFRGVAYTKWSKQKETISRRLRRWNVMEEDRGESGLNVSKHKSDSDVSRTVKIREVVKKLDSIVSAEEHYFNQNVLVHDGSSTRLKYLSAFTTYKCSYQLPEDIPSSFEGRYGHIRYTLTIIVKRFNASHFTTIVPFLVITPLDLNQYPGASYNIYIKMTKRLGFWCWRSKPVSVEVHAPFSGYCIGETINFVVEIDNRLNVNVNWVRAYFRKLVTYRGRDKNSRGMIKRAAIPLCGVERGPAFAGDFTHWAMNLKVPSNVPPSKLHHCSIIDLAYDLLIQTKISGIHRHMTDGCPLLVGTTPLIRPEPQEEPLEDVDLEGAFEPL